MAVIIQKRRGTAAQWTAANPILADGEEGFETDTQKSKVGNGVATWTALSYTASSSGGATNLDGLTDVVISTPANGQVLKFNGTNWVNDTDATGGSTETGATIKTKLEALTGTNRLEASAIQNLPAGEVTLTGTQTLTNKTLTSPVINTPTGIVKADVGLANVDNTSDAAKPVSTATQSALNLKADASAVATNTANIATNTSAIAANTTGVLSIRETITSQPAHGFTAGQVLRWNGTAWVTAIATTVANSAALGVIESVTTNTFVLVYAGKITLSGLTAGSEYFLSSSTAGATTTTEPSAAGTVSKPVFFALSATTAIVQIQQGFLN